MKGWVPRLALAAAVIAVGVGLLATSGSGQTSVPPEPQTAARYALVVEGTEIGSFAELVGITTEAEVTELATTLPDGSVTRVAQPGTQTPSTLVLRRGHGADRSLWLWHEQARAGRLAGFRDTALMVYGPEGALLARYLLVDAWPSKLEVHSVKVGDNWALYETVTLVTDDLLRGEP